MFCTKCGQSVQEGSNYCQNCGKEASVNPVPGVRMESAAFCPVCGTQNTHASYCAKCGAVAEVIHLEAPLQQVVQSRNTVRITPGGSLPGDMQSTGKPAEDKGPSFSISWLANLDINWKQHTRKAVKFALIALTAGLIATLLLGIFLQWLAKDLLGYNSDTFERVFLGVITGGSTMLLASYLQMFFSSFSVVVSSQGSYYDSYSVELHLVMRTAVMLFVPLLSIQAARLMSRASKEPVVNSEKDKLVSLLCNSTAMGLVGAVIAIIVSAWKYSLLDGWLDRYVTVDVYQKFSPVGAFAAFFVTSLVLQCVFQYCSVKAEESDPLYHVAEAVSEGLKPVGIMLLVWTILIVFTAAVGLEGWSGEMLLAVVIVVIQMIFAMAAFTFGSAFYIELRSDYNYAMFDRFTASIAGVDIGWYKVSIAFILLSSLLLSGVLFLGQFAHLRAKYSDKQYWMTGGISLAAHLILLASIASLCQFGMELRGLEGSAYDFSYYFDDFTGLSMGMQRLSAIMLLLPAACYAAAGFFWSNAVVSKAMSVLKRRRIPVVVVLTLLLGFSYYNTANSTYLEDLTDQIFYYLYNLW